MPTIQRQHLAMATQFAVRLVGDDEEHLDAVATAIFEEIDRVERLLSRFDPASEVRRVNAQAATQAVRITQELADVLDECRAWWQKTEGVFDIVANSEAAGAPRLGWDGVELDVASRSIRFADARCQFDLGAYGKGYALDCARKLLYQYKVNHALLHGGTSSILAIGASESGAPWQVVLPELEQTLALRDAAFSTSANYQQEQRTEDIFDPRQGTFVAERRLCFAVTETAALAEVLSTTGMVDWKLPEHLESWSQQGKQRIFRVYLIRGERSLRRTIDWAPGLTSSHE